MKNLAFNFGFLADLSRRLASLRRDQRGVSAIEFAMVLPLMVTLYFGAVEISQGVAIHRKVTLTARTVADLASQVTSINNNDMTNLLSAASAVVAPFPVGQLKVTVTAVDIDNNGGAKVAWSDTLNGQKRAVDSTVTVPTVLNIPNTQLIWSEVYYNYVPTVGYVVTGAINLFDQIYMRPRMSDKVQRTAS
jgi:Flp pilus assembly protein TadG